jgi:hypothetical protein
MQQINKISFSKPLLFNNKNKLEPGEFLNKNLGYKNVEPKEFYEKFIKVSKKKFGNKHKNKFKNIIKTDTSCGRKLYWQVWYIPPYTNIGYHEHANFEYNYIAEGEFYELRYKKDMKENYCNIRKAENIDATNIHENEFITNKFNKGNAFVNQPGTIHLSFTQSKSCVLYTLWSEKHANIKKMPSFLKKFTRKIKKDNNKYTRKNRK